MQNDIAAISDIMEFAAGMYDEYQKSISELCDADEKLSLAEQSLETSRATLLLVTDPLAMGKNEEQRKAWLRDRLLPEVCTVEDLRRAAGKAKSTVEVNRIRCRWCDNVLRYMELVAGKEQD